MSVVGKNRQGRIALDVFKVTPEGGIAIQMVNNTGVDSIKGTLIQASVSVDNAFEVAPIDGDDTIGIVYNNGIPEGKETWVVILGIAECLLEDTTASSNGNWTTTGGTTPGRCDATIANPPGAVAAHFKEIGHAVEAVSAGTDKLAKIMIHFN